MENKRQRDSMNSFVKTIRQIVADTLESKKTAKVMFGKVLEAEPLSVFVDSKMTLPEGCLIVPKHLRSLAAVTDEANPVPVNIDNALRAGDSVALLRVQGGQKFVILGVIE